MVPYCVWREIRQKRRNVPPTAAAAEPTRGLSLHPLPITQLMATLRVKGYRRLSEPVQLAPGLWTSDWVDCQTALAEWRDLKLACEAIVEAVAAGGHVYNAVGGQTLGANALSVGCAAVSGCSWFSVRKEPKQRGTRRSIEGAQLAPGDRALLVDDVVITGASTLAALEAVEAAGAEVVAVVALLDRSGLAAPRFLQRGIDYYPMITHESFNIELVVPAPPRTATAL